MYNGKATKKRGLIALFIVLTLMMSIVGAASLSAVFAEDGDNKSGNEDEAIRTIMIYLDGASSEANNPVCSAMIKEYVNVKFDRKDIRIIVMTGGSSKWHLDSKYLRDKDGSSGTLNEISNEYNQIWEVYGATDDGEGYIRLLDGDGVSGDGEDARKSVDELMSDPDTLNGFINFAKDYAPAEKYCLILNDHGSGPGRGYGMDDHNTADPGAMMSVVGIKQAISESNVVKNGSKFDFINLDCCMMGNFETALALSDYTDCYMGSADVDPLPTVDYKALFDYLSSDPDMDAIELGRKLVDLFVDFYEENPDQVSVGNAVMYSVVDTKALKESGIVEELLNIANQLRNEATEGKFYDEIRASKDDFAFAYPYLQDFGTLVEQLGINTQETDWQDPELRNAYTESALTIQNILHDEDIIYSRHTEKSEHTAAFLGRDDDGAITARGKNIPSGGLSLFYLYDPSNGDVPYEVNCYIDAMGSLADELNDDTEKRLFRTYRQAIIDYHLIYSAGIAVSSLVDSGCNINEIDFDKVKEYYRSQADKGKWSDFSKILSSSDRDVEAWLNEIIGIQKKEVLNREKASLQTERRNGTDYYRINITDTPKRIIDVPVLSVTAKLDNEPFQDPTMVFYGSVEDSSYLIPKFDGQWYAVEDSEGNRHLASRATDNSVYASFSLDDKSLGVGELLFDDKGNAKSIYVYGNTKPISLDSLEGTVMVTLENDPFGPNSGPIDMPFILEKTNARLIKDHYSNLGIEDLKTKLAISDMYGVEHEIKPELTFDPNGGTWADGGSEVRELVADLESRFKIIDAPERDGYTFVCWKGSEYQPGQKYLADSDHTFTAQWKKSKPRSAIMPLKLRSTRQTQKGITLKWNKPKGSVRYIVYGNQCGKKYKKKRLCETKKTSLVIKKILNKKLKKGTYYKFQIVAMDENNNMVARSVVIYAATKGGKVGNVLKLTLKMPKKGTVTMKPGAKKKITVTQSKPKRVTVKKYVGLRYESSNVKVATVTSKGVIRTKGGGTAKIIVYTQNGLSKTIKVTVKGL